MKKGIIGFFIVLNYGATFCQQTPAKPQMTKQDYLQKSKSQKTTAWILLGGGTVAAVGGGIWFGSKVNFFSDSDNSTPGAVLFTVGLASMLGSIPFFVMSANNKEKATQLTVGFMRENYFQYYPKSIGNNNYPAIALRIGL